MGNRRHIRRPDLYRVALLFILLIGVTMMLAISPVFAMQQRIAGTGSFSSVIRVPAHENVDTVLALGHPVVIEGNVSNSVIAIGGNVDLRPGSVTAFVLAIGGKVTQASSAVVEEGVIALGWQQPVVTTLTLSFLLSMGFYLLRACLAALLFFCLLLGGFIMQKRDSAVSALIEREYLRLFGTGLVVSLVPLILGLASLLTPVLWIGTAVILVIWCILSLLGLLFIANAVGRRITRSIGQEEQKIISWYGTVAIILIINVPLVGIVTLMITTILGLGVMMAILRQPALLRNVRADAKQRV